MTGQERHRRSGQEKIGPEIGHDAHAHAEDGAVVLHRRFDIDRVAAAVEGEHVFLPLCHPFDRASQDCREIRDGNVFREHAAFLAKATPDICRQDTHATLGPVQELGHIPSDAMRCLGRVPHR